MGGGPLRPLVDGVIGMYRERTATDAQQSRPIPRTGVRRTRRLCCCCSSGVLGNVRGGEWRGGCGGGLERAIAHDGGTAVEDAGRGHAQGQVAGEVVEQPWPRREDGRVNDEEVLIDQAW